VNAVAPEKAAPPLVLALDVGTSSCRASIYDAGGRRVSGLGSHLVYAPQTTADGGAELDADILVQQVAQVIDRVAEQGRGVLSDVAAVAACTFWHSLLGIDERGLAATPVYLWLDARARHAAEALKRQLDERAVHARTGCVLHWSYWPAKLLWLSQIQPRLFRGVRRWLSFGEYLALRLCGHGGLSISIASGTGLFNQHTCDWDEELLAALPIRPDQLSPISDTVWAAPGRAGATDASRQRTSRSSSQTSALDSWPALREARWLLAVGDGACSNLGAGCATRERLALMVGTSGALRVLWRTQEVTIPWGAWCYRADRQRILVGGALNDGGSLIDWLQAAFRLAAPNEAERQVASVEPDAHGLTVLPFWGGERSPGWAADARGAILGLRLHTSPIEILRAGLEAVAISFRGLESIVRQAVPGAREVVATGGALLRSPAWLQIMADVLGQPVLASAEPEASSRGAALLALEALGSLPADIEALPLSVERVYEPNPTHTERYRAAAERQARLYHLLVSQAPGRMPPC
jgi:gluconokinase